MTGWKLKSERWFGLPDRWYVIMANDDDNMMRKVHSTEYPQQAVAKEILERIFTSDAHVCEKKTSYIAGGTQIPA